jgi:hypothetical protein
MKFRIAAVLAASVGVVAGGCGSASKAYDIGPIFPLSTDKCAKYHGNEKGTGVIASCMVTKDECEKATADWQASMTSSGVNDAIRFTCS